MSPPCSCYTTALYLERIEGVEPSHYGLEGRGLSSQLTRLVTRADS